MYVAPALRPEIQRYLPDGRLAWITRWTPEVPTVPPSLAAEDGHLVPRFREIQRAIAAGPDGRIYVLATPEGDAGAARLLSFDAVGTWRGEATVPIDAAILADRWGRIRMLEEGALNRSSDAGRTPFPGFALASLENAGDTIRLESLRGRIVVVNVWASWCAPCREELPLLDRLAREMLEVTVLGLNDDTDPAVGLRFARALGLRFPGAVGHGRLVDSFALRSLPHTVVLDAELRVVGRVDGFGGSLESVRELVRKASAMVSPDGRGEGAR